MPKIKTLSLMIGPPAAAPNWFCFSAGTRGGEEVPRIQSIVPEELPRGAVKLICSRPRNYVDLRSRISSILGGEVVRQDPDFLTASGGGKFMPVLREGLLK